MFKGVTPGGEEFIVKFEKNNKGKQRPNFLTGTLSDVIKLSSTKPLLLYLSGDDNVSRQFEAQILTRDESIQVLVRLQNVNKFLIEQRI